MIMGLLNDIVKRDLSGNERKEDVSNLYPGRGGERLVKIGEYMSMSYNIITRGTYPCVDIMFGPARMKCGNMVIGDRNGNDMFVSVSKIYPFGEFFLVRISYNGPEDYIRDFYESGKVHTLKSITDDVEWLIDRMMEANHIRHNEYGYIERHGEKGSFRKEERRDAEETGSRDRI